MVTSVFDLFKVGVGPSSSHTVGPMKAANMFVLDLDSRGLVDQVGGLRVDLYGSLALTGKGHATDIATLVGLTGEAPESVDPDAIPQIVARIRETGTLPLAGQHPVPFDPDTDLVFNYQEKLPEHANGMRLMASGAGGAELFAATYFSVGGGFVATEE